jgi:hypothetical protein
VKQLNHVQSIDIIPNGNDVDRSEMNTIGRRDVVVVVVVLFTCRVPTIASSAFGGSLTFSANGVVDDDVTTVEDVTGERTNGTATSARK